MVNSCKSCYRENGSYFYYLHYWTVGYRDRELRMYILFPIDIIDLPILTYNKMFKI